jgi:hypothetical protein
VFVFFTAIPRNVPPFQYLVTAVRQWQSGISTTQTIHQRMARQGTSLGVVRARNAVPPLLATRASKHLSRASRARTQQDVQLVRPAAPGCVVVLCQGAEGCGWQAHPCAGVLQLQEVGQ